LIFLLLVLSQPECFKCAVELYLRNNIAAHPMLAYQYALLAGFDCQVLGEAGVPGLWKELQCC